MTIIETTIGGLLLAIFTGMLGLLIGGKKRVTEEEFKAHIASEAPHRECPVHTSQLSDIKKVLDRVDKRIYTLVSKEEDEDDE